MFIAATARVLQPQIATYAWRPVWNATVVARNLNQSRSARFPHTLLLPPLKLLVHEDKVDKSV